jgi:hypothetical protein
MVCEVGVESDPAVGWSSRLLTIGSGTLLFSITNRFTTSLWKKRERATLSSYSQFL